VVADATPTETIERGNTEQIIGRRSGYRSAKRRSSQFSGATQPLIPIVQRAGSHEFIGNAQTWNGNRPHSERR